MIDSHHVKLQISGKYYFAGKIKVLHTANCIQRQRIDITA